MCQHLHSQTGHHQRNRPDSYSKNYEYRLHLSLFSNCKDTKKNENGNGKNVNDKKKHPGQQTTRKNHYIIFGI